MVNTRIAPSPTGDMHIGTARTAYFNWLQAKSTGGKFVLRIDDTDKTRHSEDAVDVILKTMEWLGLDYDGYCRQSTNKERYRFQAEQLISRGYTSTLSNGAIALKHTPDMPKEWTDTIAGVIPITATNIKQINERLILLKGGDSLGEPTYQFASVVDDWFMNIGRIIRGVDHSTNTAKQVCIAHAIDHTYKPLFTHVGLITKNKKKLSKRDGAASILKYQEEGYSPEALLNFMLRMGWSPNKDNKENSIINRDKAIVMFDTEGSMRNSPAGFDQGKLDWYQKKYKIKGNNK